MFFLKVFPLLITILFTLKINALEEMRVYYLCSSNGCLIQQDKNTFIFSTDKQKAMPFQLLYWKSNNEISMQMDSKNYFSALGTTLEWGPNYGFGPIPDLSTWQKFYIEKDPTKNECYYIKTCHGSYFSTKDNKLTQGNKEISFCFEENKKIIDINLKNFNPIKIKNNVFKYTNYTDNREWVFKRGDFSEEYTTLEKMNDLFYSESDKMGLEIGNKNGNNYIKKEFIGNSILMTDLIKDGKYFADLSKYHIPFMEMIKKLIKNRYYIKDFHSKNILYSNSKNQWYIIDANLLYKNAFTTDVSGTYLAWYLEFEYLFYEPLMLLSKEKGNQRFKDLPSLVKKHLLNPLRKGIEESNLTTYKIFIENRPILLSFENSDKKTYYLNIDPKNKNLSATNIKEKANYFSFYPFYSCTGKYPGVVMTTQINNKIHYVRFMGKNNIIAEEWDGNQSWNTEKFKHAVPNIKLDGHKNYLFISFNPDEGDKQKNIFFMNNIITTIESNSQEFSGTNFKIQLDDLKFHSQYQSIENKATYIWGLSQ